MANTIFLTIFLSFVILAVADDESAGEEILKMEIIQESKDCVRKAKYSDMMQVYYTGSFLNGTVFDTNLEVGTPFEFQLGSGNVIRGWDKGLIDMCVGEKRKLTVPYDLAYGEKGTSKIPPKSTLVFEIELVDLIDAKPPENVFKQIDLDGNMEISKDEVKAFMQKQAQDAGASEEHLNTAEHDQVIESIFEYEDKDKDGIISHEEFSGPKHDPKHDEL